MMSTAGNNGVNVAGNGNDVPITNPNSRVNPTPDNPRDYPPFDMRSLLNYMNNQIIYYFISGTIPAVKQARFQQLLKQHKISLELLKCDDTHSSDEEDHVVLKNNTLTLTLSNFHCSRL